MASALDIITGSLRLIGACAEGETPSAATAEDSLTVLNDLIDTMRNESQMVYQVQSEVFTLPASTTSRTIGAAGNYVTTWPVALDPGSCFVRDTASGLDYPLTVLTPDEYARISLKTVTGPWPSAIYYERAYPTGTLYFYPLGSQSMELHLGTWKPLTTLATLATDLAFPPGYNRMFRFNLAVDLASEFGQPVPQQVSLIAASTKAKIKKANARDDVMGFPGVFTGRGGATLADFYAGRG